MASIRTISFGKDFNVTWDTGKLRDLVYDHEKIKSIWEKDIYNKIRITSHEELRNVVHNFVRELVRSGKIHDMQSFCDYIMAIRLTRIDETKINDDGFFDMDFMILTIPEWEKRTFWNITWHINHHCKQLWKVCLIQTTRYYDSKSIAVSYTTGEAYDRDFSMDYVDIRKTDEAKNIKQYIKKSKTE